MDVWTIYEHPSDHPTKFVVRRAVIANGRVQNTEEFILCDSVEEAQAHIPLGLVCFQRQPEDDPVIVECWL